MEDCKKVIDGRSIISGRISVQFAKLFGGGGSGCIIGSWWINLIPYICVCLFLNSVQENQ